jgi:hypothetical protein
MLGYIRSPKALILLNMNQKTTNVKHISTLCINKFRILPNLYRAMFTHKT